MGRGDKTLNLHFDIYERDPEDEQAEKIRM